MIPLGREQAPPFEPPEPAILGDPLRPRHGDGSQVPISDRGMIADLDDAAARRTARAAR